MGVLLLQFNEEGEVALRLALQVVGAPNLPVQPLQLPTSSQQQQQQPGRRLVTSGGDAPTAAAAAAAAAQQSHAFELGIHLNLTQLMGLPSTRHVDKLSAERAGLGKAARGVLLIGDLGLQPDDLSVMPWRAPPLGIGVLPAAQRKPAAAAAQGGAEVAVVVEGSTQQHASTAPAAKSGSRQPGKSSD
jgi:hypothetical protein